MEYSKHHDYLIIGGGPAGLQAGYYLEKNQQDYLIIEADEPGTFFQNFPRHRKLISINKIFTGYDDPEVNLRWDWNSLLSGTSKPHLFKKYSQRYFPAASDMSQYLCDYAEKFQLKIRTRSKVEEIRKNNRFQVKLVSEEILTSNVLIVATGFNLPWLPDIPGIDSVCTYCDMNINASDYNNKRVLIIGKGNSAFETADALVEHTALTHLCSPSPLKMAWSTHYVGHLRAVNNNFLDTYQLKSQNAILDAEIKSIEKTGDVFRVAFSYKHAEGEQEAIEYDHVIACTGGCDFFCR